MAEKIKLTGGPEKTVTWIWLEEGHLKIEFYDFSETAQRMFGNDIAYIITVHEMDKLFSTTNQDKRSLIPWMAENFKSYFGIKQWLEEHEIGFDREIDPWA
ncbi:MAG TPA: hypothetical protein VFH34_14140 [Anaerolineales bacterium]|nr:hypothetical protein [Anaerolineales bacterium]